MLRAQRSINARQISEHNQMNVFLNASCVAYVYASTFKATQAYIVDGKVYTEEEEKEGEGSPENLHEQTLKSRDPVDWLSLLGSLKGAMPKPVKTYVRKVGASIRDPREGTVDAQLMKLAAALPE